MLAPALVLALCLTARPADAVKGKAVATVKVAGGAATFIDAKKNSFPVTPDTELLQTDTVAVPIGGLVVLELTDNHHLVRIDEDLELAVKDIALLHAPRAKASLNDQVDQLLTARERDSFKVRMMGWYASPTAANVPSATTEERVATREKTAPLAKDSADKSKRSSADGLAAESAPAKASVRGEPQAQPSPRPPSQMPPQSPSPAPVQRAGPAPGGALGLGGGVSPAGGSTEGAVQREAERSDGSASKRKLADNAAPAIAEPRPPIADPAPLVAPVADEKLSVCLSGALKSWGSKVAGQVAKKKKVTLKYRRTADGLFVIALPNALPTPDCVHAWFVEKNPSPPSGGWQTFEVTLK